MAFRLERFAELRPYLYHLTATGNLARVRAQGGLECAATLLQRGGRQPLSHQRRREHLPITVDGMTVTLRDQAPLHEGNIEFETGWTLPQVVALLNQRVFFWPGTDSGPIESGRRHFKRYEGEQPTVIRVRTESLLRANPSNPPLFCRYNSGSPRCSDGNYSPRGPSTFQDAGANGYRPGEVVEVTFLGSATLPGDAELRGASWSEWGPFFPPTAPPDTRANRGGA